MKVENILEAEDEAKRFLKRLKEVRQTQKKAFDKSSLNTITMTSSSKATGALKRSSLDLTRALSKMRNNIWD